MQFKYRNKCKTQLQGVFSRYHAFLPRRLYAYMYLKKNVHVQNYNFNSIRTVTQYKVFTNGQELFQNKHTTLFQMKYVQFFGTPVYTREPLYLTFRKLSALTHYYRWSLTMKLFFYGRDVVVFVVVFFCFIFFSFFF